MSVLDISSVDGGLQLEELNFAGVEPVEDGPSYEELLSQEAKIASGDFECRDRSAFKEGLEIGRQTVAQELLERSPGGFSNQAEAARWARWVAHRLDRISSEPWG